jgi:hypothetical protein
MNVLRCRFWFAILLFSARRAAAAEDNLRVEGILYEPEDGNKSIVIVNGTLLKEGDSVQGYRVKKIERNSVALTEEESGRESVIRVTAKPAEPAATAAAPPKIKLPGKAEDQAGSEGEQESESSGFKFNWNPLEYLNKSWELKAIVDLLSIQRAGFIYYESESGGPMNAVTLGDLVKAGYLDSQFEDGENGKYRFRLAVSGGGFEVSADPLEPGSDLLHFYAGQDGVLRAAKGESAGPASPIYEA